MLAVALQTLMIAAQSFDSSRPVRMHARCMLAYDRKANLFLLVQVEAVNGVYPGRASISPMLDLFMTLLHWGASGTAYCPTAATFG